MTKINIIIGDPIEHSISPQIHNLMYQKLGIDKEYVYLAKKVKNEDIEKFVENCKTENVNGLACTVPHKVEILKYLDEVSEEVEKIGAANTVLNINGKLHGYNTDWLGIYNPIVEHKLNIENRKVGIIGAGGASRATCFALKKLTDDIVIYNRTFDKAINLANEFGVEARLYEDLEKDINEYSLIVNTTSVGMGDLKDQSPISFGNLQNKDLTIFDIVYTPFETKLIKEAKGLGLNVILGYEMFLHQAVEQFEIFTGKKPLVSEMREDIISLLNKDA
jgi:shikimate dehydrogenase